MARLSIHDRSFVLFVLCVSAAADMLVVNLTLPNLPIIVTDILNLPAYVAGLSLAAYAPAALIAAPTFGLMSDRLKLKYGKSHLRLPFLVSAALVGLAGISFIATILLESVVLLFLSRILVGLGGGGLFTMTLTTIDGYWKGEEAARIVGLTVAFQALGQIIGPLIGGPLFAIKPWAPFVVIVFLGVLDFFLRLFMAEPDESYTTPHTTAGATSIDAESESSSAIAMQSIRTITSATQGQHISDSDPAGAKSQLGTASSTHSSQLVSSTDTAEHDQTSLDVKNIVVEDEAIRDRAMLATHSSREIHSSSSHDINTRNPFLISGSHNNQECVDTTSSRVLITHNNADRSTNATGLTHIKLAASKHSRLNDTTSRSIPILKCLYIILTISAISAPQPGLPLYLQSKYNLNQSEVGVFYLYLLGPNIIFGPLAGELSKVIGYKYACILGSCLALIAASLDSVLTIRPFGSMHVFGVFLSVWAGCSYLALVPMIPEITQRASEDRKGAAAGWVSTSMSLGLIVGPVLGSVVYEFVAWWAVMALCAAFVLAALVVVVFIPSSSHKK